MIAKTMPAPDGWRRRGQVRTRSAILMGAMNLAALDVGNLGVVCQVGYTLIGAADGAARPRRARNDLTD